MHRENCINIKDVTSRLIDVSWNDSNFDDSKQYVAKLVLETNSIKNNVLDIVTKAQFRNVIVSSINENTRGGVEFYDILVKVRKKDDLDLFVDDILTLSFVTNVKRY